MLCQTIELTKDLGKCPPTNFRPELPKVRKRMLKHLEKIVFWSRKEKATYTNSYFCK